jgi:hypothetical protein
MEPRPRLTKYRLIRRALVLEIGLATMACGQQRISCDVITLDRSDTYVVQSRYRNSWFDTECSIDAPRELLIKKDGYSIYVYLDASPKPQAYLGVRSPDSSSFELTGPHLTAVAPSDRFSDRATRQFRAESAQNGRLEFDVKNRNTGTIDSFSFILGKVPCTCKLYDGP